MENGPKREVSDLLFVFGAIVKDSESAGLDNFFEFYIQQNLRCFNLVETL